MPDSAHLLAGAVSGMASTVILQPLDLIKTRLQESTSVTKYQDKSLGLRRFWRGTLPSVCRNVPGTALYFMTLERLKNQVTTNPNLKFLTSEGKPSHTGNLALGSVSRSAIGFVMMPLSVLKVRFESSGYQYSGMFSGLAEIFRGEGLRGLFKGYAATVLRDAPFAGLYVVFYEKGKLLLNATFPTSNMAPNMIAGLLAGTSATLITQPFDMLKTRIQLEPQVYKSIWNGANVIISRNGFGAFFKGSFPRVLRKTLSSAITWTIYEELVKRSKFI